MLYSFSMFLSITIADSLIWALYILLWSSFVLGALAILQFAKAKLWIRIFSNKTLALLSGITFLISAIGINAFQEKFLIASASGKWNFGYSYQNELRINMEEKTYLIKESNGKIFKGFVTTLTKGDTKDEYYLYIYLLGYPNEMSSTMVKFSPLHSPQLHLKNQVLPCK